MGRKPRIEYEGALYHVIQRGNNKENILSNDAEKGELLKDIFSKKDAIGFKLVGYVIMSNHYHLLVQTADIPLSVLMHRINNRYSKYYNKRHNRTGHVFQERYKAIPVQNERYLLALIRYIHQNPVRAGLCCKIEDYAWSSDYYYRGNVEGCIDLHVVLDTLSPNREIAIKQYREIMQQNGIDNDCMTDIIGDECFCLVTQPKENAREKKRLDEVLADTGIDLQGFKLIKEGSRQRFLTPYKLKYAKRALELNYTFKEIAQNIKISDAAIYKMVENKKHTVE